MTAPTIPAPPSFEGSEAYPFARALAELEGLGKYNAHRFVVGGVS